MTLTPDGPYLYGDTVVVSAEPAEGYRFDGWSTGPVTAEQTLTLTADVTLTANFSRIPVTLTLNSAPAGVGLYTVSPPAPHFYGDTVTVTARTQPGWNFRRWRNRTTAATFSVQLTRDVTFTAEYEPYPVLSGPDRHIGNDTTYRITWVFAGSPTSYTIEESYDGSSYRAFQTVRTSDTAVGIDIPVDRAPGTHCYRVRASGPGQASVPSNEHCVERAPGPRQVRIVNDLPSWRQSVGEVNAIVSVKFAPVIGSINWDTISESMRHSPRSLPGESIRPQGDSMTFAIPTSYPTTYSMFFGAGWYDGILNPFPPYNFQGYERRLTRVFGCDCTTTVFKAEPLQINHTFDTLTINASQFMARADYCGDPVCR